MAKSATIFRVYRTIRLIPSPRGRRQRAGAVVAAALLILSLAVPGAAQDRAASAGKNSDGKPDRCAPGAPVADGRSMDDGREYAAPSDELLKRWRTLSTDRKGEIRELYLRIQKLPPEMRESLMARFRALDNDELRRSLLRAEKELRCGSDPLEGAARRISQRLFEERIARLSAAERARFHALDAEGRRQYFCERLAWERQQLLASLPPDVRTAAEALPPRDQARFLRNYEGEETSKRVFPAAKEREYLAGSPRAKLAEFLEAGSREGVSRPAEISERSWQRWLELEPYERLRVLRHLSPTARDRSEPSRRGDQK